MRVQIQQKQRSSRILAKAQPQERACSRRDVAQMLLGSAALVGLLKEEAAAAPFLSDVVAGGSGPLAEEEAKVFEMRKEAEVQAKKELQAERSSLEQLGKQSQDGKLCATPLGVDVVGITEFIGLTGAIVGGLVAKQRKDEVQELNQKLRKINQSLRQQARAGVVYAPDLTYAPPSGGADTQVQEARPLGNGQAALAPNAVGTAVMDVPQYQSMEDDQSQEFQTCRGALKEGKQLLKKQQAGAAVVRFEKALMLSKAMGYRLEERKAMRGLAACARLQKRYKPAIQYLERVLEISNEINEHTGDSDAFGVIADNYTDLGEFDKAAQYYDKYLSFMNNEGPL